LGRKVLILWALGRRVTVCIRVYRIWGLRGVPSKEIPVMGCVFGEIKRLGECEPRKRLVLRIVMRRKLNEKQNYVRTFRQFCRRRERCLWRVDF
jgi:hypothetical protein